MKRLRQLLNFYIHASIHVAFAVYAMAAITLKEFSVLYDESVLNFIFFASVTGYNFVKYLGMAKFYHRSLTNWLKIIQLFSFFCFLLMCYFALQLHKNTLACIALFGLITFFYAVPFLPNDLFVDKQHNLRSVSGLKIYLIALVWSGVTVVLPVVNNKYAINADVLLSVFQRFCFVMVLMLPFEIRDLNYDSLKLSTVPQKIGVKPTKLLGVLLLITMFITEFFKNDTSDEFILVLLIISVVTGCFVVFSKKEQGRYYSAFWVEGLPILWLILLMLFG